MDAKPKNDRYDADLVSLLAEAMEVQRLVLQSPELSLNRIHPVKAAPLSNRLMPA